MGGYLQHHSYSLRSFGRLHVQLRRLYAPTYPAVPSTSRSPDQNASPPRWRSKTRGEVSSLFANLTRPASCE